MEDSMVKLIKTLAVMPNADENIKLLLNVANETNRETSKKDDNVDDKDKILKLKPKRQKAKSVRVEFTKEEINLMPTNYKLVYKKDGSSIYAREHKSGKNETTWEIRYRKKGFNISVCGKTLEIAKRRFLDKLLTIPNTGKVVSEEGIPKTFHSFSMYYFENYRVKKVAEETYKKDLGRYKKYLEPYFKETLLTKITLAQCQKLVDDIKEEGKGKTSEEVLFLMNGIFRYAKNNHIIQEMPTDAVVHVKHERTNGVALTKDEEKKLLFAVKDKSYEICFAIVLYTGLRPNEYESAELSEDKKFIIAKNSKQKKKRNEIVYKKIPVTPMLSPYIEANPNPKMMTAKYLRKVMNNILPDHILYDLRTTFYSRCKECGVNETAYKLFMGHSLKEVDGAYTDMPDEYLIKEGRKIAY